MSYEQLSHWMAEIGHHGFDRFAEAHNWATRGAGWSSANAALRELSALAYIEVDWRGRRWGAVPPCLTLLPDAAGHGLIVGARTARLTREVIEQVTALDAVVTPVAQQRAPDALFVAADSETALAEMASSLGIPYVHSVVERLAAVLPDLDAELAGRETPPVVRHYGMERYDFDTTKEAWIPVAHDDLPGLYRYERSGPRVMHLVADDTRRFEVDLAVGAWADARRQGSRELLWWRPDAVNGTLDVPMYLPLPSLHARAATLCSGLSPTLRDGGLLYANVPEWLARDIAATLSQDLVIK
jgi:hypothetical protein